MSLPNFDSLPNFKDLPGCAWDVWPADDELGTINLLTDEVVKRAAQEEIRTGKSISLNWPVNFPENPMFARRTPEVTQSIKIPNLYTVRDDDIHFNTQSGTQWDGMKHFGLVHQGVYYKGIAADSLPLGRHPIPDPLNIDPKLSQLGIQSTPPKFQVLRLSFFNQASLDWAKHGICGRGVLLDLVSFYTEGGKDLPYDPFNTHAIGVVDLEACAKKQGVEFRKGDILLLRVGFVRKYNTTTNEIRGALGSKEETFAGIDNSDDMKRFIWNNHFAAIGSDQPALESWPAPKGTHHLHETLLGLWGMPIGEFFDLEELAEHSKQTGRYTFYFSSWPMNMYAPLFSRKYDVLTISPKSIGGCASPANAAAQF
ncbi:hypothetical protein DXG01_006080 [Tephrocybe rancida]|nr:hypothetical protein DXG01_006080 [Tephrocybe rancida]